MFIKAFHICAIAAVALGIEYPPGIHPAVCPNYPYCDMEVLARHTPQGLPIPDWELPYARMVSAYPYAAYPYAAYPYGAYRVAAPITAPVAEPIEAKVGAIEYPADVDPAACPNYPYCDKEVLYARMVAAPIAAPIAEPIETKVDAIKYPADFEPAMCPNYPYCDMELLARHTPQGLPIPDWELPYARMVAAPIATPIADPIETKVDAIKYPADFDPTMCPNYPYCDMELLARHTPQGLPIPDWELPYARTVAAPIAAPIAEPIETKVDAIEYPADVDPASCPNYPYCA